MFCIFVTKLSLMDRMHQLQSLHNEDPNDLFVRFAIAKEYEKAGDTLMAIEQYEKILELNADYIGVYYHLAHLYGEQDRIDDAMDLYDKGIGVSKKIADFHAMSELLNAKKNLEMENL